MDIRTGNAISFVEFVTDLLVLNLNFIFIKSKGKVYNYHGEIVYLKDQPTTKAKMMIDKDKYNLWIDLDQLDEHEEYLAILHEVRHAYQMELVKQGVNDEFVIKFEENFNNYITGEHKEHLTQPVELDAQAFTLVVGREIFKVELDCDIDKALIGPYIECIYSEFDLEEIKECMHYSNFNFSKVTRDLIKKGFKSIQYNL